jgi:hypothetical protein
MTRSAITGGGLRAGRRLPLPARGARRSGGARQVGYRKITLWTNDVLRAARHIYAKAGVRVVRRGPHRRFGHDLVEDTWELAL